MRANARGQALLVPQLQRQLAVHQESRRSASEEFAQLTSANISLNADLEVARTQAQETAKQLAVAKACAVMLAPPPSPPRLSSVGVGM